ncbi:MAG: hypothetical protein A3H97_14745 [Acidobacteria bacterium RIFCSPLOWO2_02_FULL_65_29]|nr:MAG: hypothetical protein A3H97_14745 [Acidobacteria bacterium RIFCSPLOWO2_02_FULL_65_29]
MASPSDRGQRAGTVLEMWNRQVHYYLGLYFFVSLWLFSLTGLLLNHPQWALSRIPNDANPEYAIAIEPTSGDTDLARARDIVRQLGLKGEIDWPQSAQAPGRLDFNVTFPKRAMQLSVDLREGRATVRQIDRSLWSAVRITHTFSGSRYNTPGMYRDWLLTSMWVTAMDALAAGLLIMVIGSYYMWYQLKTKRASGWIALVAGFLSCGWIVFGLA